MLQKHCS